MEPVGVVIVILMAMGFNYTNGFHDAANAIATSVSTRALTPRIALAMASVFNLIGSFFGAKVAKTVGSGIISLPPGTESLVVVFAALFGAIGWNLFTWYYGLPSSSSQALIGGLVGAAVASGSTVLWPGVWDKIVIPSLVSPLAGFLGAYLLMVGILWAFRRGNPTKVNRGFRMSQSVSAAAMAFGHGIQDGAKIMGVVVLALQVGGYQTTDTIPIWVFFMTAVVLAAGTYSGGWRIMRTLGRRIIELDPPRGFAAESTASSILYIAAIKYGAPISTTHVITASIMGAGATKRMRAVRWGVVGDIVSGWVLTLPGSSLLAAGCFLALRPFFT